MSGVEAALVRCDERLASGDHAALVGEARELLRQAPDHPAGWAYFSLGLARTGCEPAARVAMWRAVERGLSAQPVVDIDIATMFMQAVGETEPRAAEIVKPCPLFGRFSDRLSAANERTISAILASRRAAWEAGEIPEPADARCLAQGSPVEPGGRLLLIASEYIDQDASMLRNDVADVLASSAAACGFEVTRSRVSERLLPLAAGKGGTYSLHDALAVLRAEIAGFKPDIVLFESNICGRASTIQPEFFADRASLGYRMVAFVADLYDTKDNVFDYWAREADAVVYLNRRTTHVERSEHRRKGVYWPSLPFFDAQFAADPEKTFDFSVVGSDNPCRTRAPFSNFVQMTGLSGRHVLHDRRAGTAPSSDAYRQILEASRMAFNNGRITNVQQIVTGRVFEIVRSRCLLLEEDGADTARLFVPFVHYMPVANVHQLACYAQYFARHEEARATIARAAAEWCRERYAGGAYWGTLLRHLARQGGA